MMKPWRWIRDLFDRAMNHGHLSWCGTATVPDRKNTRSWSSAAGLEYCHWTCRNKADNDARRARDAEILRAAELPPPKPIDMDALLRAALGQPSQTTMYISRCQHCGQRNQWKPDRMHQKPRCAKCGLPLAVRF